ncbi:hypothetical protein T484DRAFT_1948100 [Baffinella frigidus]|nr:hypothetical protein T484DRAFT_1948100 [Cryptophyta sp. CCMP2293]
MGASEGRWAPITSPSCRWMLDGVSMMEGVCASGPASGPAPATLGCPASSDNCRAGGPAATTESPSSCSSAGSSSCCASASTSALPDGPALSSWTSAFDAGFSAGAAGGCCTGSAGRGAATATGRGTSAAVAATGAAAGAPFVAGAAWLACLELEAWSGRLAPSPVVAPFCVGRGTAPGWATMAVCDELETHPPIVVGLPYPPRSRDAG